MAMLTLGHAIWIENTCSTFGRVGKCYMGICNVLRLQMHVSIGHSLIISLIIFYKFGATLKLGT